MEKKFIVESLADIKPHHRLIRILRTIRSIPAMCWCAGGQVLNSFKHTGSKDTDLYFPAESEFEKAKAAMLTQGGKIEFETERAVKIRVNPVFPQLQEGKVDPYLYAVTKNLIPPGLYDLVKLRFDNPGHTIGLFDFTVVSGAVRKDPDEFYCHPEFRLHVVKNRLVIHEIYNPVGTLKRVKKYMERGFKIDNYNIMKLAVAISKLGPIDNPEHPRHPEEWEWEEVEGCSG